MIKPSPLSRVLFVLLVLFLLFLYGPTLTIAILSFQGPLGSLTFPLIEPGVHWFAQLFEVQRVGDIGGSLQRSLILAVMVMIANAAIAVPAGLAFRRNFRGGRILFALTIASLIVPSVLVSLGIGLLYSQTGLSPAWYSSAFGAQLTWTLPFGVLIMVGVFARLDKRYEEAAVDAGATRWQTFRLVIFPMILPNVVGVMLFGFTLSYDELPRTVLTGGSYNTLPLEIYAMTNNVTTPVLYALGTLTTLVSAIVITIALGLIRAARRRVAPTSKESPL
ncbi:MAG: ABC transporter permease [Fulvimarina manganoxydans]|uniref:ABC transporter permease n=1 Tax=Fulvimarina manganoxydans TaxID=937218 RepID=UPI002357DFB9|nr:ABC transporter permease [Fulvimarina manganoxydans]MCK5932969.1 ABC transporter permease [Fulvimarina manganoxydans]